MTHVMYIPTQEERYSKIARITLLLCVIVPSGVVAWLSQGTILACIMAFLLPIAAPLIIAADLEPWVALSISALVQAIAFFAIIHSRTLTSKGKVTIAITWGMLFALILKLMIAFEAWQSVQAGS